MVRKIEYQKGEAREGGLIEGAELVDENMGKFLDWTGKKTGLKIQVAEGLKGNAEIDVNKGVMRVNPYSTEMTGAVGHELTHLIKQYDRKAYNRLQRLTIEAMMKAKGMTYEQLYAKYEAKYTEEVNSDYTVEDILEEITADGATAYINDADFAERLAREDRSLAQKIADFFREIADTLKAIIDKRGIRAVGKVMLYNEAQYRVAANTWYQALEKAGTRYKEGYTAVTDTDADTKFMLNEFGFEEHTNKEKNTWAENPNIFICNTKSDIEDFIEYCGRDEFKKHRAAFIGKIGKELAKRIQNDTGLNVEGRNVVIGTEGITHALAHHGNAKKEALRGQVQVVANMFADVPEIIGDYDSAIRTNVNNVEGIRFEKEINGKRTLITISSEKRNTLRAEDMWQRAIKKEAYSPTTNSSANADASSHVQNALGHGFFDVNIASKAEKDNTKFQLADEPIEYTRDLIAVRNVNSDNLASMLELEGMPSPSIAITKDSIGHTQFGDVTFIFGRNTIDPEADSRNMVFTSDAWTPTYDQLGVDTEIKEDKLENMRDKFYAYSRNNIMFRDTLPGAENFSHKLDRNNGDLHQMADKSYDWKLLYLNDINDKYEIKSEKKEHNYTSVTSNENTKKLANTKLREIVENAPPSGKERWAYFAERSKEIKEIFEKTTGDELFKGGEAKSNFIRNITIDSLAKGINNYLSGDSTTYTEIYYDAAKKEIDAKINTADYHKWVDENFKGAIGRKGIRNERDMFTRSGDRRSFRQLHDAYTAENIVKALWRNAEQGVSSFGSASHSARTVRGATAEKMDSIADIHAKSGLLQSDVSFNVGEAINAADEKLSNIYNVVSERAGSWSIGWDEAYNESTIKAATKAKTANEVRKYFADNSIKINETEAKQLFDIFEELRNLPTDYFEAKAKRVVGWDEVKLAVVPDDIDPSLVEQMREKGIRKIEEYPSGDNAARLEIENKAEDLKFQLDIDDDPEQDFFANIVHDSNAETQKAADTLGQLLSLIDYMPSEKAIRRTAKRIKEYTATDTDIKEIESTLFNAFNFIANVDEIDGREWSSLFADYAGELISNSSKVEVDPVAEKLFRDFRNTIKNKVFHMPEGFDGEVKTLGGIRAIRSQSGMAINITKDKGPTIDTLYDGLCTLYPGYFDKDITNPADQLEHIIDTYSSLKPKPVVSYATEEDYDAYGFASYVCIVAQRHRRINHIYHGGIKLRGALGSNNGFASIFLNLLPCFTGNSSAALRNLSISGKPLGVMHLGQFCSGSFSKHIKGELQSAHIIAEVFFLESFKPFIFACTHARPRLSYFVCEYGVLFALLNAVLLPCVGQFLACPDREQALIYPVGIISLACVSL